MLSTCMLAGVSRLEAAVAEDKGAPSDTNALTLAAALDQLALVCPPNALFLFSLKPPIEQSFHPWRSKAATRALMPFLYGS